MLSCSRAVVSQLLQSVLVVLLAPLVSRLGQSTAAPGCQNSRAAGLLQPYRDLHKLFSKDAVLAHNASWLFRGTPYILFGAMWLAVGIVPVLATDLPFAPAADVIALVGLFALARVFMSLAAMDVGTAFGGLGARREMLIGFLAEPAMLMTIFTASLISHSTCSTTIVENTGHREFAIYPSMAFAAIAFVMVLLAENARIPVDNPATHLELTMIHEAMILEYSARHLALIEWASALKLLAYIDDRHRPVPALGHRAGGRLAGAAASRSWRSLCKLVVAGAVSRSSRRCSAKLRIFRAPEFLATAFLLGAIGLLVHFMLGAVMPAHYADLPLAAQIVHVLAALLLLIAFAMLAQRRILALIHLFAWQGLVLTMSDRLRRGRLRPAPSVLFGLPDRAAQGLDPAAHPASADPAPATLAGRRGRSSTSRPRCCSGSGS